MTKIEIYHNVSRDGFFGLNAVLDADGKREARSQADQHPLVKVFEYETWPETDDRLCEAAFHIFNVGTSATAKAYRDRNLRSLSVGDVVTVDGRAYSCESAGFKARYPDELRFVRPEDAEGLVRKTYDFGRTEPLSVTVPWEVPV